MEIAVDERAPKQIPITIQHIHKPPTDDEAEESKHPIELRNGAKPEWHKEKRPKEVVRLQAHPQQECVQQKTCRNVMEFVLLDVLCRRFLHGETGKEINDEKPNHAAIHPIERLQCRSLKIRISREAKHHQIYSPKGNKDITQYLHCHVFLKHRVTTRLQPLIVRNEFI